MLINDILARPDECAALVDACAARAVCVANTFRCKIPHKKAFFAVLTDPRNAALFSAAERDGHSRARAVDARPRGRRDARRATGTADVARAGSRVSASTSCSSRTTSTAATGVNARLGDVDGAVGRRVDVGAGGSGDGTWVVQERIPVRREVFPQFDSAGTVTMRDMLVDFAPYLFRGRMGGYLTRLSASGLANVTSGGGQVPAFVVDP